MIVFLNGKLVHESKAHISIDDHGFLYGDGVYETLRVYNKKIFRLEQHLDRLRSSLRGIDLKIMMPSDKIGEAMEKVIKANRHTEASIRLTVTRGPGPHGFDPRPCKNPTILITSRPFSGYPKSFYKQGVTIAIVPIRRNSPDALPPSIKSTSCLNNILAKMEANKIGADEAIMLADDGSVAEGTVSNIFLVKGGKLFTPVLDGHQLPGVTREVVCQLAQDNGLYVSESRVSMQDLMFADEVFLTSSLMEIVPVQRLLMMDKTVCRKDVDEAKVTPKLAICYKRFTHP